MPRTLHLRRLNLGRASRVTCGHVGWTLEVKGMYTPA